MTFRTLVKLLVSVMFLAVVAILIYKIYTSVKMNSSKPSDSDKIFQQLQPNY